MMIKRSIYKVGMCTTFFLSLMIAFQCYAASKTENTFRRPDFAFPKTVEKNAEAVFKNAINNGNDKEALIAAVQLGVSQNLISNQNCFIAAERFEDLSKKLKNPYSQLATLLEARVYADIYQNSAWKFNQRKLSSDSVPKDVQQWSGEMFSAKIMELVSKAMAAISSDSIAGDMRVSELGRLTTFDELDKSSDIDLYSFMTLVSVDMLSLFPTGGTQERIPFTPVPEKETPAKLMKSLLSGCVGRLASQGKYAVSSQMAMIYYRHLNNPDKSRYLKECVAKYISTPYCAEFLLALPDSYDNESEGNIGYSADVNSSLERINRCLKERYAQIEEYLKAFPDCRNREALQSKLMAMCAQTVGVSVSERIYPGSKGSLSVESANMFDFNILIVKLPDSELGKSLSVPDIKKTGKVVESIKVRFSGSSPIHFRDTIALSPLESGVYVAVASSDDSLSKIIVGEVPKRRVPTFCVSRLSLLESSGVSDETPRIYVVDGKNGSPIAGATLTFIDKKKNKADKFLSDKSGMVIVPAGNYELLVEKGKDIFKSNIWSGRTRSAYPSKKEIHLDLLTNLSIYHPGDSVGFVGMVYQIYKRQATSVCEKDINIFLRNVNGENVDSVRLISDRYGRISGFLKIPAKGLLGRYSLVSENLSKDRNEGTRNGYVSFDVSDYKSPTFYVETEGVSESVAIGETVTIKGRAATYSGMPLTDAKVRYRVAYNPWFRFRGSYADYSGETTTTAEGNFHISLPTSALKNTRFEKGLFSLSIEVTDEAGETQSACPIRFSLGNAYSINVSMPEKIDKAEECPLISVRVNDAAGFPVDKSVFYKINPVSESLNKNISHSGIFNPSVLELDILKLPVGEYEIVFSLNQDLKDSEEFPDFSTRFVVYDSRESVVPVASALWVPQDIIYTYTEEKMANIKVGNSYADGCILMMVSGCGGVQEYRWLKPGGKMIDVSVKAPAENERIRVEFISIHDYGQTMQSVDIIPRNQTVRPKCELITFRDRLVPGQRESWKIRFTFDQKAMSCRPVAAVMSNKALNSLAPFSWQFNPFSQIGYPCPGYLSSIYANFSASWNIRLKSGQFKGLQTQDFPKWNTYGYTFHEGEPSFTKGVFYSIRGSKGASVAETVTEYAAENKMMKSAMAVKEESAPLASVSADMADNASSTDGVTEKSTETSFGTEEIRQTDCPLAFFLPNLLTDSDGVCKLDFTVPSFNGTWQLQLLSYTEDMRGITLMRDAVSAKPVMVKTNLPRFVRTGDLVSISATLYNATDDSLNVSGRIELFNPEDGNIVSTLSAPPSLLASQTNRVITISYLVPDTLMTLGVRAFAISDRCSDGEQGAVAVLPSSTPVIESAAFHIAVGERRFAMNVPNFKGDGKVVFQYCDNPVWEVVKSLPDLKYNLSNSTPDISRMLYSNLTVENLFMKYPQIGEAINAFMDSENRKDSTLISNLMRDNELKLTSVELTPWLADAESETMRMMRLAEYLDKDSIENARNELIGKLIARQLPDGGWCWCENMPSSEFITTGVLSNLSMLCRSGNLPDGLMESIRKGVNYADSCWIVRKKEFKGKQFPYSSMLDYLLVRSCFNLKSSALFSEIERSAISLISKEWGKYGIYDKAKAAILLARKGKQKEAGLILESLRQYASVTKEEGMWFDNLTSGRGGVSVMTTTAKVLEAFAEISPSAEEVDMLRQWLLNSLQTLSWSGGSEAAEVAQALLCSGSGWLQPSEAARISISGVELPTDEFSCITGCITTSVSPGDYIEIIRSATGPAWGGFIKCYVSPIVDVKAASDPVLKIDKKIYRVDASSGKSVPYGLDAKVGDKVRCTLTVKADTDCDYIVVPDERSACLQPDEQISGYIVSEGVWMYREVKSNVTNLYIPYLSKGTHVLSYDCHIDREGEYSIGVAQAQSLRTPEVSAHSAGTMISVER